MGSHIRPTAQDILVPIWNKRKTILVVSFLAGLITYGVNFLFSDYYKSTASLLPVAQKGKLSALGQLADVASLAGVTIPGSETSRLYPSIIASETVLRSVILNTYKTTKSDTPINLIQLFDIKEGTPTKDMNSALMALRSAMSVSFDPRTGIVTMSVVMPEAQLAADVMNAIISELDKFMREKQTVNASEQVKWLEVRLSQVEDTLRKAEETLKNFREKNRRISDSPDLILKQERLNRDVQVSSTVFIELKKQYELAKLEEIKNMQIVNVLDPGRAPAVKAGPRRKTNAGLAFLACIILFSSYFPLTTLYSRKLQSFLAMFQRRGI